MDNIKKELEESLNANLTKTDKWNIIEGIFEKVIQTTIQPLMILPSCSWDKWEEFCLNNRLQGKLGLVLTRMITLNHCSLIIMKNEDKTDTKNKVDIVVPLSTSKIELNRSQRELDNATFVIPNKVSLLYNAATATSVLNYTKKGNMVYSADYPIMKDKKDVGDGKEIKTDNKIIPVVWFNDFFGERVSGIIQSTKKAAYAILEQIINQMHIAGPNIMFIGSANNVTTKASAMHKAMLDKEKRVHKINESLNQTVSNPVLSFNNQPYFQQFWDLIESMVNSLIEGLQVGDMNQGGKGTANMHTTEVMGSFGIKLQKIMNTHNMFLSSWYLLLDILRDNGISIPKDTKFSYDIEENVLRQSFLNADNTNENKDKKEEVEDDNK